MLGIFIGAFLGHALAIRRGKYLLKHNASIELRKIFLSVISRIESGENPIIVITNTFQEQQNSSIKFSAYLDEKTLISFKNILNDYQKWYELVCNRTNVDMLYDDDNPIYIKAKKISPITYINSLLDFTR